MLLKQPYFWQKKYFLSFLLLPLSVLYLMIFYLKKVFCKKNKLRQNTIVIGNLNIGGAGKTPTAIAIFQLLKDMGFGKIAFLTRGYGGNFNCPFKVNDNHNVIHTGDEAQLLKKIGDVIISKKRYKSQSLLNHLKKKIVILDDGLQHFSLKSDIKILVIDGKNVFFNGFCLPAGPLREISYFLLRKIDIIIYIGNKNIARNLKKHQKKIFLADYKEVGKYNKKDKYIAFSGLANNNKFFKKLEEESFLLIDKISFSDHYFYKNSDIEKMLEKGDKLITTSKDMVKIDKKYHKNITEYKIELDIFEKERLFYKIKKKL